MRILCEQVNINIYITEGLGKNPTALSTNSLFYNFFVVSSFLLKRHAYEFLAFIFLKRIGPLKYAMSMRTVGFSNNNLRLEADALNTLC